MSRFLSLSLFVLSLPGIFAGQTQNTPAAAPTASSGAAAAPASALASEEVKPDSTVAPVDSAGTTKPVSHKAAEGPPSAEAYVLGPEDSLYIRVWHEPDLSGTVDVRPDGYISIQLIGEIKADGLTVAQLANSITKRLTEYIKTPEVNVQLLKVNSKKYSIQGEVNRPGTYPLTGPTTLLEALVNASGFRDFANTKKIYLLRGTQRFPFNYKMVSKGKELDSNIMVHTGDQIFVP
jgi:polysaccharide export outer membrane protein